MKHTMIGSGTDSRRRARGVAGALTGLLCLAVVIGLAACGGGTTTTCTTDSTGTQVCSDYAVAYPYDYAYVDPLYGSAYGYAPYTIDTYADPAGYDPFYYSVLSRPLAMPAPPVTSSGSNVPELLDKAHRAAGEVNAGVRAALDPIRDLIKTPPVEHDQTLTFGPADHGGGNYRFTVRRLSAAERRYGWRLDARAQGQSGEFTLAAGGLIRVGDSARRGQGVLGIDGDALGAADPAVTVRGKLRIGFLDSATDKLLDVALDGFTPDPGRSAPLDARVIAWRRDTQANDVRLVLRSNLAGTATPALETIVLELQWRAGVGVRVDAVATGGDVAAGQVLRTSTCVGPTLDPAGASTSQVLCSADGATCALPAGTTVLAPTCPAGLDGAETPAIDPEAVDPPAGLPQTQAPPATIPDGSGQ